MENSPPGIHTIASGAGLGGLVELMDVVSNPAGRSVSWGILFELEDFEASAVLARFELLEGWELGPRKLRAPAPPPIKRPTKTQGSQDGRLEAAGATGLLREDLFIGSLDLFGDQDGGIRG